MTIFVYVLLGFGFISAVLQSYTFTHSTVNTSPEFVSFQRKYLVVFLLAQAADWLQGPYVYALYAQYGFGKQEIAQLFVAGFGSSLLFGTFIGGIADRFGRKKNCIMYGVLYSLACLSKHSSNFHILLLGRILSGISTSLLYSAFESWMVHEHNRLGFSQELLGKTFSLSVLGNSVTAILSGILSNVAAHSFGYVCPFDLAAFILTIMTVIIVLTWEENYGDVNAHYLASFQKAITAFRSDSKIVLLGAIQSLFEGSMYLFIFLWTPILHFASRETTDDDHIPHGTIFATFMVALMIGSSIYKILQQVYTEESFLRVVFAVAGACLATPIFYPYNLWTIYGGFLVFEICTGIFWPSIGVLRSKYVPTEIRSTILNFFRVPLNTIVIVILLQDLSNSSTLKCCVVLLVCAVVSQQLLFISKSAPRPATTTTTTTDTNPVK